MNTPEENLIKQMRSAVETGSMDSAVGAMGLAYPKTMEEYFKVCEAGALLLTQWSSMQVMGMAEKCPPKTGRVWQAVVLRLAARQGLLNDVMDLLSYCSWSRGAIGQALERAAEEGHEMVVRGLARHSHPADRRYLAWALMRQPEPKTTIIDALLDGVDVTPLAAMLADDDLWKYVDRLLPHMTETHQRLLTARTELHGHPHAQSLKDGWALDKEVPIALDRAPDIKKM